MPISGELRTDATFIHPFDAGTDDPTVLGGKGASLARMRALGLPVPPGFTIGTAGWRAYRDADGTMPEALADDLRLHVRGLGTELGRAFGDAADPLLVSVRSGAPVSMPGMMDTVLNLGLTDAAVESLAETTGRSFALQLFRRLLSTYASVVRGLPTAEVDAAEAAAGDDEAAICAALKDLIAERSGQPFPQDAGRQLAEAVEAVWRSWDSRRAKRYRRYAGIADDIGTAVVVQAMVFGNRDAESGTGVVFTRDPATGAPRAYGDYLACAQGEDVVAGGHNTLPLEVMAETVADAYAELQRAFPALERAYRDMVDVEFTVESGRLWILQARPGQRSGAAAVHIAVDLVDEGLIDVETALERVPAAAMQQLQAPVIAPGQDLDVLGRGTPAAPGAGVGVAVFDSDRAHELAIDGTKVILVRPETSPEDIAGMIASSGIVTAVGGRTSHAAVVARGIGRPAVCGVATLDVRPEDREAVFDGRTVREGDAIAIDGDEGLVVLGAVRLQKAAPGPRSASLLAWADEHRAVPIIATAPAGFTRVTGPEEACDGTVLIDVEWEGAESGSVLSRTVEAVLEAGADELALQIPNHVSEGDMRLPPAPWSAVVADEGSWIARLVAARLRQPTSG